MNRVISKNGALKAFYYLMAVDGDASVELERFDEIGSEFMKEEFSDNRQPIIDDCETQINTASIGDDRYDIIQEGLDKALNETTSNVEDGVMPRLLIWDMLSIAYFDDNYTDAEKRLIAHVARILEVEKDVLIEMEHLMKTADAVVRELETLNSSNRPYSEIRPIVDEIEKRKLTITRAAEELIADDFTLDTGESTQKSDNSNNMFSEAGKKISESLTPVADQVGDFAKKSLSDAKELVDKIDTKELTEGAEKLFSKIKGFGRKEK